jgi:hypothetical protein
MDTSQGGLSDADVIQVQPTRNRDYPNKRLLRIPYRAIRERETSACERILAENLLKKCAGKGCHGFPKQLGIERGYRRAASNPRLERH